MRFPTSRDLGGSDVMSPDRDYSAAYVVLPTNDGEEGDGFAFIIGHGNDVQTVAISALSHLVSDRTCNRWSATSTASPDT